MRSFIAFIIILVAFFVSLQSTDFFAKTRDGHRYEYFNTVDAKNIPPIMAGYLRRLNIKYFIYKTPNYVKDLFLYNSEFRSIETSKPKCTVIVFPPSKEDKINSGSSFDYFYEKLTKLFQLYPNCFNKIIFTDSVERDYPMKYDNDALKSLKERCGSFCLVDPNRDTIFVFRRTTVTEGDALDVVFQEYNRLLKNNID